MNATISKNQHTKGQYGQGKRHTVVDIPGGMGNGSPWRVAVAACGMSVFGEIHFGSDLAPTCLKCLEREAK